MSLVTFIIGNGLDLSLGLNTSYKDFYQHIKVRRVHKDNRIYKAISDSPVDWADFELSLGKYTSYLEDLEEHEREAEAFKLHEELNEVCDDLANYLEKEENAIDNLPYKFSFSDSIFSDELPSGQRSIIANRLSGAPLSIGFVTLNYTKTLQKVIGNREVITHGLKLRNPQHLHGSLSQDLTLGVSDESQLSSVLTGDEKDDLIKPNLIRSMNDGRLEAFHRAVHSSSILVLYGTSIGETDKYIWQIVTDWLNTSSDGYVIIHKYDPSYEDSVERFSRKRKQFISAVQHRLLTHSKLDGDEISELKNRIFVIHNTKQLFIPKQ